MNNLKLTNFSAVIFDMDGLVLDTETTYFIAWQQAAAMMGYTLSDKFCESLSGLNWDDVQQKLLIECGANFNLPTFTQTASIVWHDYVNHNGIQIKRGFHELLAFISQHQLPTCLATNSRKANALECLTLAGLDGVFPTLINRDDVLHGKPAPDIFLTAAERLHVPIQQCLVLEDSHAGIVAAHQAGAFTLFIPSTLPIDPLSLGYYDLMLPDLIAVLESFRA